MITESEFQSIAQSTTYGMQFDFIYLGKLAENDSLANQKPFPMYFPCCKPEVSGDKSNCGCCCQSRALHTVISMYIGMTLHVCRVQITN